MRLIELESHPIIEGFRKEAPALSNTPNEAYHLLVPPEYNISVDDYSQPLLYLFVENASSPGILRQYCGTHVLEMRDGRLFPKEGFDHEESCRLLQATPCTTTNGFAFEMHEIASNPFMPSPEPPLCEEIQAAYDNPKRAFDFLYKQIRAKELVPLLDEIREKSKTTKVTMDNREDIIAEMQDAMNRISDVVFGVRPFKYIPTLFKIRTNYVIFYAVTGLFHRDLLEAYHVAMKRDDLTASQATKMKHESLGNPDTLNAAAEYLMGLAFMDSVAEGIEKVKSFFETVLKSLPEQSASADDILPAVCDGICRCSQNLSLASTFQYLADVWPPEGLEEKITYVLTTCAIAVSHLSTKQRERREPVRRPEPTSDKQNEETIACLQALVDDVM